MRSPSSSRSRSAAIAALAGVVVFGLVAERHSPEWRQPSLWIADLVVGLAFVVAAACSRRRRAIAVLLGAAGAAWFVGTAWPALKFLHRGVLTHLALAAPDWRLRRGSISAVWSPSTSSRWARRWGATLYWPAASSFPSSH